MGTRSAANRTAAILKVFGLLLGVSLVVLGVGRLFAPEATMPGSGTLNATVDSESRAMGALLIGLGVAYLWAVRQAVIPARALRLLALIMALLAVSRVISIAVSGTPHWTVLAGGALEAVAAVLTYWYSTMRAEGRQAP